MSRRLMDPVKRQFGRLHVEPGDLAGRGVNSPLFSLAYLALKAGGAKDWYSGLGLSLTHQGKLHFIQWHHVIPKSLLKAKGYETGEINEIANMAFITGQTNRRISNKEATGYLADIVSKQGEGALRSQCVPTDPALWTTDRYRDFLQLRRAELATRMNAFIEEKAGLMSQFVFLQREWSAVFDAAARAEAAVHSDPRTACFYARRALELAVAGPTSTTPRSSCRTRTTSRR